VPIGSRPYNNKLTTVYTISMHSYGFVAAPNVAERSAVAPVLWRRACSAERVGRPTRPATTSESPNESVGNTRHPIQCSYSWYLGDLAESEGSTLARARVFHVTLGDDDEW
jgi:hypothetical protein